MTEPVNFVAGGTVQAGGGFYIPRQADQELLALCRSGAFAYVLTPRQMGKSSLMVQTAESLQQQSIRSVKVDLTTIGTQLDVEAWYLGLLTTICRQLQLVRQLMTWWPIHKQLGVTQRLTQFFEEVILEEISEPIVIFIDEIDTTLNLDFTDDFFIAIRSFYLSRANDPKYDRLSFVLFGVATPSDLIKNPQRTPFNIGQRVDLTDFTLTEAAPLAQGFDLPEDKGEQVLKRVMDWTGGHPYLTQRLCRTLTEKEQGQWNEEGVADIVHRIFLGSASKQDTNLQFVRDMLTRRSPDLTAGLDTYSEVLKGKQPVADEEQSIVKAHLKLSGIVKQEDGVLQVRNPIYAEVFGMPWIREHLPINWAKRLRRAAVVAGTIFLVANVPLMAFAMFGWRQANLQGLALSKSLAETIDARMLAEQKGKELEVSLAETEAARNEAETRRVEAEKAQKEEEAAKEAEAKQRLQAEAAQKAEAEQRSQAEAAREAEAEQRLRAEEQTEIARAEKNRAEEQTVIAEEAKVVADLREQATRVLNWLPTPRAVEGLVLAMHATIKSRELSPDNEAKVASALESSLLQATEEAKEKMIIEMGRGSSTAALSPDGQIIVNARVDGSLQLLDVQGNEIKTFEAHDDAIVGVGFSTDSQAITSIDRKGTVKRWNLEGSSLAATEALTTFDVVKASFSDDGQTVAASLADGSVATQHIANGDWTEWMVNEPLVREVNANIDENDEIVESSTQRVDSYEMQGRAGQSIEIQIESEEFEPRVTIEDAMGDRLVSTTESIENGLITRAVLPEDGNYNVIATHNGGELATGAYRIHIDEIQLIEPPILQEEATLENGDAVFDSQLQDTQLQDTYTIQGRAGQRLVISMESDDFDSYLSLENAAGEEIDFNDDAGNSYNSAIQVSLPDDGLYTIVATRYQGETQSGEYSLKIQESLLLNPPILQETTAQLEDSDRIVQDFIRRGDKYPIEGVAGQEIFVGVQSEDFDTYLSLEDESGESLEQGGSTLRSTLPRDGNYNIIVSNSDGVDTGAYDLVINPSSVKGLSINPEAPLLLTTLQDGGIQLWDLQGIPKDGPWLEHQGEVLSLDFSPDGQQVVSGGRDRTLRLWDLATGTTRADAFRGHGDEVLSVAFSSDGKQIISGGQDGTLLVWNLQGDSLGEPLRGHGSGILAVTANADNRLIMSQGRDATVRLWEANNNITFRGHQGAIAIGGIAFSPDGQSIVSGSYDGTLRLWDLQGSQIGHPFRGHEGSVYDVEFSPNGRHIASAGSDGAIRLWDMQGTPIGQLFQEPTGVGIHELAFSPDGRLIAGISDGPIGNITLWNRETGQSIGGQLFQGIGQSQDTSVGDVAFSPDSQRIVTSRDNTVQLFDSETRQAIGQPLQGHTDYVRSVAFSPDGQRIVSGSFDRTIRLWDSETGQPIGQPFRGHEGDIHDVTFSPDGRSIASASDDGTVRLWDSETGQLIGQPFRGHGSTVHALAFSPDGQRIVSGSGGGGELQLWLASGESSLEVACNRLSSHPILRAPRDNYEPDFIQAANEVSAACDARVWEQYSEASITP